MTSLSLSRLLLGIACFVPEISLANALILEGDYSVPVQSQELKPFAKFSIYNAALVPNGSGGFSLEYEMPRDLMMGQRMEMSWEEQPSGVSGQRKFVGQEGVAECTGALEHLRCDVKFQDLNMNPNTIRQELRKKFGGTSLEAPTTRVALQFSAEPIGTIQLFPVNATCPGCNIGNGVWDSSYRAQNGQMIRNRLYLDRTRGSYSTNGGNGLLSNITYSGRKARGRWQFGSSTGWFEFSFGDDDTFSGIWGLGNQGSPANGTWTGERTN